MYPQSEGVRGQGSDLGAEGHGRAEPAHTQQTSQDVHKPNGVGVQHLQHTQPTAPAISHTLGHNAWQMKAFWKMN